jgi:competence protein ComEA
MYLPQFYSQTSTDFTKYELLVDKMIAMQKQNNLYAYPSNTETSLNFKLFPFDPNTAGKEEWLSLGVSPKSTDIILKYREKGGRFTQKEDLLKIYGFNQKHYKTLEPYITLPDIRPSPDNHPEKKDMRALHEDKKTAAIEINSADTLSLQNVYGIGKILSHRIIKYRNLLGGFYDKQQVLEVFGISKETYNSIKDQILIDKSRLVLLPINFVSSRELSKHPYISYELAGKIIHSRNTEGPFQSADELQKRKIIVSDSLFQKISPYLKCWK